MKPSDIVELGIAQVLEGRRIFSELTVTENLRLGGHTASKDIKENIDRVFDLFPPKYLKEILESNSRIGEIRQKEKLEMNMLHLPFGIMEF